jgi:hypothetical protein
MTDRKTKARRLERAGFVALSGWVPAAYALKVEAQVEMYREDVERAARAEGQRGRPKKVA